MNIISLIIYILINYEQVLYMTILVYKNIYLFFIVRKVWNAVSQKKRQETEDCYVSHHIFLTHVVILY